MGIFRKRLCSSPKEFSRMLKLLLCFNLVVLSFCGKLRFEPFSPNDIENNEENVKCSDTHICPTGTTCCMLPDGEIGCCPFPDAVCCSDHTHCCPKRHKCIVSTGRCAPASGKSIAWSQKLAAKKIVDDSTVSSQDLKPHNNSLKFVKCPGGKAKCPDGYTCCHMKNLQWGCCPLKDGLCREDHEHCCPKGYTCNDKYKTCKPDDDNSPEKDMLKMIEAEKVVLNSTSNKLAENKKITKPPTIAKTIETNISPKHLHTNERDKKENLKNNAKKKIVPNIKTDSKQDINSLKKVKSSNTVTSKVVSIDNTIKTENNVQDERKQLRENAKNMILLANRK